MNCDCMTPDYPRNARGVVGGNICKRCKLKIDRLPDSERGGFITTASKAVADLKLDPQVQEELWTLLRSKVSEWVRQSYLMADHNARRARLESPT